MLEFTRVESSSVRYFENFERFIEHDDPIIGTLLTLVLKVSTFYQEK